MRRVRLVVLVVVAVVASLVLGAGPASAYLETTTSDPVAAAPPVSLPATSSCTVTLADKFPSNAADGSPQNYTGTLTPPTQCAGPWAKVVLTQSVSVSGRQYDRLGSLRIGDTDVWYGTTQEPSGPNPVTYTFSKDITEYSSLLRTPQPYTGGIGNYVTDVYTGNYVQTVKITYYRADRRHPAPAVPDAVVGLGDSTVDANSPSVHKTLANLPRNITRAELEITLKGNGCDEQWFDDVPDAVSAKYPDAGLCGKGAYREADVTLDNTPVAAVHTFPYIYSGGIVPTLWRPILAIGTLSMDPERVDVTPFVGELVDGKSHDLGVSIQGIGDTWNVVETLLLYTDHHAKRTHGALLQDSVAPAATVNTAISDVTDGGKSVGTKAVATTSRRDVTSGYVVTSAGRVTTTVVRTMHYRNADTVTDSGLTQAVRQQDSGVQKVFTSRRGTALPTTTHSYSYPLSVDFSAAKYVDDQNFTLTGTVSMTRQLADSVGSGRHTRVLRHGVEKIHTNGVLSRANGVNSESDGSSTSSYVGTDDLGRHYEHYLASNHGVITKDVVRR